MTKQEFLLRLKNASLVTIEFTERYVTDKLSSDFKYHVIFTPSYDAENCSSFNSHPEDEGITNLNLTDNEVVDLLYRKNKIPVWIDINVLKSTRKSTTFNLACAGRYSDKEDEFYYNENSSDHLALKDQHFPLVIKRVKNLA